MRIDSIDPRLLPARAAVITYWVIFWAQHEDTAARGVVTAPESDEYLVRDAESFDEVERWAVAQAGGRQFEIYIALAGAEGDAGLSTRLRGTDPTVWDSGESEGI